MQGRTGVAVAVLLVVLAGCTTPTGTPGTPTAGPPAPTPMAPWTPAHPVVLPTMSDAEALDLRAINLAGRAGAYGLTDPPVVELVRWTTMADYGATVAACLRDAGFNAVGAGGIVGFPDGIGPAQQGAYHLAEYTCDAEYSMHPKYLQVFTAEQWGLRYDYDVEWLVPCLVSVGGAPSEPPTRDTYVARALAGDVVWDPYSDVQGSVEWGSSIEKTVWLNQTCPPDPLALWGG